MKPSGIARKVDDLGRIVLPIELRRLFGIRPGDEMEITITDGGIQLRKVELRCVFCDGTDELRPFRRKQICDPCAAALTSPTLTPPTLM